MYVRLCLNKYIFLFLNLYSFATSCDNFTEDGSSRMCICKPNYYGDSCEDCGAGYFGEPEELGK